jgi:RNA 2',3'-cyclic 3'-phosphodiesterase
VSASATAVPQAATQVRTERLFAALPLPDNAVADLAEVVADLNIARRGAPSRPGATGRRTPSTRLVRSENWHLTLSFLGEVPADRCAETAEVIAAAARESEPMRLCVSGGGRFGRGRYSVVYAGLDGDVAALIAGGLPVDQKQYRPHVTLARPGDRVTNQQAAQDLLTLRRYYGPSWTANEVVLYRSDFGKGPVGVQPLYTPVAAAPLG